MKYIQKCLFALIFLLAYTSISSGQYYENSARSGIGIPYFDVVLHNQFDPQLEGYDVLVLTQFLYDDLTFTRSDTTGYEAAFELLIAAYDESENVVFSRTVNKKINVPRFELTNSREETILLKNRIDLNAGKYTLLLKTLDLSSNQNATRKVTVNLKDYKSEPLFISGISFLQDVVWDSTRREIKSFNPTIGNNFTARNGIFYIYFDLYTEDMDEPVEIQYSLSNKDSGTEVDTTLLIRAGKKISSHYYKVEKDDLKMNRYLLEISAVQGKYKAKAEKHFSFFWTEVPGTNEDIDLALKQMRYIIPSDSLDRYEDASLAEKQGYFKRFWARRDPNPATTKNELKDEYFRRVNYANRNYTAFGQSGWLTDRGRILIKFGFPDDIERHPFEMGSQPYQIWRYYALRKTFVFIDKTGFGDYRLHIDYVNEEFR